MQPKHLLNLRHRHIGKGTVKTESRIMDEDVRIVTASPGRSKEPKSSIAFGKIENFGRGLHVFCPYELTCDLFKFLPITSNKQEIILPPSQCSGIVFADSLRRTCHDSKWAVEKLRVHRYFDVFDRYMPRSTSGQETGADNRR
jgi:hypothetical protein